jgi:hypothetical protein
MAAGSASSSAATQVSDGRPRAAVAHSRIPQLASIPATRAGHGSAQTHGRSRCVASARTVASAPIASRHPQVATSRSVPVIGEAPALLSTRNPAQRCRTSLRPGAGGFPRRWDCGCGSVVSNELASAPGSRCSPAATWIARPRCRADFASSGRRVMSGDRSRSWVCSPPDAGQLRLGRLAGSRPRWCCSTWSSLASQLGLLADLRDARHAVGGRRVGRARR